MAKQLSKIGVLDGQLATAAQVTQSIDAFTGIDAYDITISGSLTVTGSTNISGTLGITGFPDVSASLAAADDGFPFSGSALISGSLIVTGSTNINGLVTATSFSGDGSNITGVTGEWDGTLDGNAEITGSLILTQNLTASNISASGDLFSNNLTVNGNTTISGSLIVSGSSTFTNIGPAQLTGSTNILASEASNLTFEINESASYQFLTGGPNTGSFIVQTSPDIGKGELQVFAGQGNATVASQNIPNQLFGVKYTTGSGASQGELTMTVGKRDLTNLGSSNLNNFFVAYEPSGILTNAEGELEFHLGDHFKVGNGIVLEYRGGASGTTQTSSFAGYFSSSAFPNQQQYTRPFVISTLSQVNDTNPAFVVNKNIDHPTESKFSVDYGGNITAAGNITASGNISSSGHLAMNDIHATNFRLMDPLDVAAGPFSLIKTTGALVASTGKIFIGDSDEADTGTHIIIDPPNENVIFKATDAIITGSLAISSQATNALSIIGNISSSGNLKALNINAASAITASGHGLFQAGKPIITHTTHLSASITQAGFYNIVGGQFTCSITTSNAPIGAEYEFFQTSSAGSFLFHSGSGITLISKDGNLKLVGQGSAATLKKVATSTFHLVGDLTS